MTRALQAALTRPAMAAWVRLSDQSWRDFPRPDDDPRVTTGGPDPLSVVLIGGGPAMGYGVRSHQLSLGGQVSRQLAQRTGRGVDLEIINSPEMRLRQAAGYLKKNAHPVDVIITTFGSLEAYRLESVAAWRKSVESLLAGIRDRDPGTQVFFCGIVPSGSLVKAPNFALPLIAERIDLLNKASRAVCATLAHVTFVAFPGKTLITNADNRTEQYRQGATTLVNSITGWLAAKKP